MLDGLVCLMGAKGPAAVRCAPLGAASGPCRSLVVVRSKLARCCSCSCRCKINKLTGPSWRPAGGGVVVILSQAVGALLEWSESASEPLADDDTALCSLVLRFGWRARHCSREPIFLDCSSNFSLSLCSSEKCSFPLSAPLVTSEPSRAPLPSLIQSRVATQLVARVERALKGSRSVCRASALLPVSGTLANLHICTQYTCCSCCCLRSG